jgi:Flp pilus assembly pilin Flp
MKYWVMMQQMLQDRRGIAAVEYAVLIAVVGGVLFVVFGDPENNPLSDAMTALIASGTGDAASAGGTTIP